MSNKKVILVVDDEEEIRELITDYLVMKGFEVVCATNGVDAISILDARPEISLIVTDIRMPGGDGIELLGSIRSKSPRRPIIVMMTGYSEFTEKDALTGGANGFIRKPFDVKDLIQKVEACLQSQAG